MIQKKLSLLKCLCYCCVCWKKRNTIDSDSRELKILLLGMENVGKTEIGHILAGTKRTLHETTNGVQYFKVKLPKCSLSITEIGGSRKIQKLWHHYYSRTPLRNIKVAIEQLKKYFKVAMEQLKKSKTMGLIFCYDMSIDIQKLHTTFQLFNKIASHQFIQGKVILLIGTKSDLASNTIQLYDIENRFGLENLANRYFINIKSIHFNPTELENLWIGIEWLSDNIIMNYRNLKQRIENDNKIEKILKKQQCGTMFNLSHRRPKTAPASISLSEHKSVPFILSHSTYQTANVFRIADQVPTSSKNIS